MQSDKMDKKTPLRIFGDLRIYIFLAVLFASSACEQSGRGGQEQKNGANGSPSQSSNSDQGAPESPPVPVEVISLRRGPLEERVGGLVTLEAKRRATLRAFTGGVVRSIRVEEGDRVQEGQRLATLDRPGWAEQIATAESVLERTRSEARRLKSLAERGLSPREEAERAQFEARRARLDLRRLRREGRAAALVSPLTGVVAARLIQPDELVSAGAALFELVDQRVLEAPLYISSDWLPRLEESLPARLSARRGGEVPAQVRLARIAPTVDARSGTVKVTLEVTGGPRWLRPGASLRAELTVGRSESALRLPSSALLHDGDRPAVMVAEGGLARRVELSLGLEGLREVEVLGPLQEGAKVIIFGHRGLPEGAKILARLSALSSAPPPTSPREETRATPSSGR